MQSLCQLNEQPGNIWKCIRIRVQVIDCCRIDYDHLCLTGDDGCVPGQERKSTGDSKRKNEETRESFRRTDRTENRIHQKVFFPFCDRSYPVRYGHLRYNSVIAWSCY